MIEALRYQPEGCGLDSRRGSLIYFIELILPVALWSCGRLSLLAKMSTRDISWQVKAADA